MVELVETTEFKGKKPFSCDIQIQASLARLEARWSTLIHESLHAHSAGYADKQETRELAGQAA